MKRWNAALAGLVLAGTLTLGSAWSQDKKSPPEEKAAPSETKVVRVLDDFEGEKTNFEDGSTGTLKAASELVSDAKVGKKAIKVTFSGERKQGSWTSFMVALDDGWPTEADRVTFWAKGEKESTLLLSVREGAWPDQGGHGSVIKLTKEWQYYSIELKDLTFFVWGMGTITKDSKVDPSTVVGIGFNEHPDQPLPVTVTIDQVQFEKGK